MLLAKTIVYRILRILIILLVTFLVTGSFGSALSVSLIDAIVASIYYYYFDKIWPHFEARLKHIKYKIKYRKMDN